MANEKTAPEDARRSEVIPLSVEVRKAAGEKCERCWLRLPTVGKDAEHPTVCARCLDALHQIGQN
jgi:isoleucyl-tRNA synthetase